MCQVQINADPAYFLYWGKPMGELHPVGQAATMPYVQQAFASGMTAGNPGLRQIRFAAPATRPCNGLRRAGRPSTTSRRLHTCKPPASSALSIWTANRAASEGSHDYMMFNNANKDILKRYGIAGLGMTLR